MIDIGFEIKVGDYVENYDGKIGYIKEICDCDDCKAREFCEPIVQYSDGTKDWITVYEAKKMAFRDISKLEFIILRLNMKIKL